MIGLAFGALSSLGTIGKFASDLMGDSARRQQSNLDIRRLEQKKAQTLGLAAAQSGASGVEGTSTSTQDYLAGLGNEYDLALKAMKDARDLESMAGGIGALAGLVGGAAKTGAGLGALNNWWAAPSSMPPEGWS
jgi:hypothetical protein